jgi:hypothetical protein
MQKNEKELGNFFQCFKIEDKRMLNIVSIFKNKIKIQYESLGRKLLIVKITPLISNVKSMYTKSIIIKMKIEREDFLFSDVVGTILAQIMAINSNGGDYTNWCKYVGNNPRDTNSKTMYSLILVFDSFFKNILTEKEFDKMMEYCKREKIV